MFGHDTNQDENHSTVTLPTVDDNGIQDMDDNSADAPDTGAHHDNVVAPSKRC